MIPQPAAVVSHGTSRYPVYLARGILGHLGEILASHVAGREAVVISDTTVARELERWEREAAHPWRVPGALDPEPFPQRRWTIDAGEPSKTREVWRQLTDALLAAGLRRDCVVVAVGGGVVGDLAGFVAATYMRGIPILHVPTTLVAMVDSSIGGKTGVDTDAGKNLVGTFHQPAAVVTDPSCLLTLPEDQFRAGMSEVIKHAVLADAGFFDWLERHAVEIGDRDLEVLTHLIEESVRIKTDIVSHDERDLGRRAHLNLGHTIAHGLEHASAYRLSHGVAVAMGLVAESAMAEDLGLAESGIATRLQTLLELVGPKTTVEDAPGADDVLRAMGYDKKSSGGTLHFALPKEVGSMSGAPGRWTIPVSEIALVRRALARIGIS